jgi:hypothetical protein
MRVAAAQGSSSPDEAQALARRRGRLGHGVQTDRLEAVLPHESRDLSKARVVVELDRRENFDGLGRAEATRVILGASP